MSEVLYAGQVDSTNFTQLIADCHFSPDAKVLAEQMPEHVVASAKERQNLLIFEVFDGNIPFVQYTSGRIFQKDLELRWERQHDKIRIVYLGPEHAPATQVMRDYRLKNFAEPDKLAKEFKSYFLFGERLDADDIQKIGKSAQVGDFAELRIPRILRYPPVQPDTSSRVQLQVCEYVNKETGQVEFFRFQDLVPGRSVADNESL